MPSILEFEFLVAFIHLTPCIMGLGCVVFKEIQLQFLIEFTNKPKLGGIRNLMDDQTFYGCLLLELITMCNKFWSHGTYVMRHIVVCLWTQSKNVTISIIIFKRTYSKRNYFGNSIKLKQTPVKELLVVEVRKQTQYMKNIDSI